MQIFRLHRDPVENARRYPDKYTYNQIRESAQAMCTAINLEAGQTPYGSSHENHPIVQWLRNYDNWWECRTITKFCHDEYQRRYGEEKIHKSWTVIQSIEQEARAHLPHTEGTLQPCVFPDDFKIHKSPDTLDEVVENYRNYVREAKAPLEWFKYERADTPAFLRGIA